MKVFYPRVLLLGKGKIMQLEPKKQANFRWIEVDGGEVINTDHIIGFFVDMTQNKIKFELSSRSMFYVKSFDSRKETHEYFNALKEKLDVLV